MVVFPQAPELCTGRPQIAKNRQQALAQEKSPVVIDRNASIHICTPPYYN